MVSINGRGDLDFSPFDIETSMRVAYQRWGTILNLGTLGLRVLELFGMYATDGRTDRRTDKSNAYMPPSYGRGHNKQTQ